MNPPKPNAHSPNGPLVCITGGNGMIGRRLAERYRVDGFSVRIVSRHAPTGIRESAFFGADLLNADDVVKAFRGADRVVHLATPPSQPSADWPHEKIRSASARMMQNVLDACRANNVKSLTLASSVLVYPSDAPVPIAEEWGDRGAPAESKIGYAMGKRDMERLAQAFARETKIGLTIARFSNVFGPRAWSDAHGDVVSRAVMNALQNKPIRVFGDGSQTRSFLFVEDCVDGVRALENANTRGAPVNLAPESDTTVRALVGRIVDLSGSTSAVELSVDPVGPERGLFDVRRAKEFGFVAKTPLETGLAKTIEAYRASAPSVRPDGP